MNLKKFEDTVKEYESISDKINLFLGMVKAMRGQPRTEENRNLLQNYQSSLTSLKARENEIEKELVQISNRRSDIYPIFSPPKTYGDVNNFDVKRVECIPIFSPNDKSTRLSHTWYVLKQSAQAEGWSKQTMKDVLFTRLKGEAIDYFLRYQNSDLDDIIQILGRRFEHHLKRSDFELELHRFQKAHPNEPLLKTIERLKYIIFSLYSDRSKDEQKILEREILRSKLRKIVPPEVWRNTIQKEKLKMELGESFDFLHEIQLQNKTYQESREDVLDLSAGLHAMSLKRPAPDSESGPPPAKKPNSPGVSPASSFTDLDKFGKQGHHSSDRQNQRASRDRQRSRFGNSQYLCLLKCHS